MPRPHATRGVLPSARCPAGVSAAATRWPTRPSAAAAMKPARTRWCAAVWSQQQRPSKNRSGSVPSCELRPARRHGAQDRSVASAEGARGGHDGLRAVEAGCWSVTTFTLSTRFDGHTHRRGHATRTGWAGNPAHPVRRLRPMNDCRSVHGRLRRPDAGQRAHLHLRVTWPGRPSPWRGPCRGSRAGTTAGSRRCPGCPAGTGGSPTPWIIDAVGCRGVLLARHHRREHDQQRP